MDYKFLDKVVSQILSETTIDYEKERVYTPFPFPLLFSHPFLTITITTIIPSSFSKHCKEVYGLNEQEIEYVWEEYKRIIKDKINSNGL